MRRHHVVAVVLSGVLWVSAAAAAPVRAAYFYNYMRMGHLDSLRAHGFDRAVIHWIPDSLGVQGALDLDRYASRGLALGIGITPQWSFQSPARLASRPWARRYTWRAGREPDVPCPNDSLYWRSALLDRADEFLTGGRGIARIAIDLELYRAGRHQYDAGPCRCPSCLAAYTGRRGLAAKRGAPSLAGLLGWQEARLERTLTGILSEFRARHPGVELGVFDLDRETFVHRALARALARAGVPTADYCELSYSTSGADLVAARGRLDTLGQKSAPLIGGLWLKRFAPGDVPAALRSITAVADGYFIFTTFSLWLDPAQLHGPYTLPGSRADYWAALREANREP